MHCTAQGHLEWPQSSPHQPFMTYPTLSPLQLQVFFCICSQPHIFIVTSRPHTCIFTGEDSGQLYVADFGLSKICERLKYCEEVCVCITHSEKRVEAKTEHHVSCSAVLW